MPSAGQQTAILEATALCLRFGAVDALKASYPRRARRRFFTGDFPCSTLIEVRCVGSNNASPPLEINATGAIGAGGLFAAL